MARRIIAVILDVAFFIVFALIIIMIIMFLFSLFGGSGNGLPPKIQNHEEFLRYHLISRIIGGGAAILITLLYFAAIPTVFRGTPGLLVVKGRITLPNGESPGCLRLIVRAFVTFAPVIIGFFFHHLVFYDQSTAFINRIKRIQDMAWLIYLLLNLGFMLLDKSSRRSLPDRAVNTRIVKTVNAPVAARR